MSLGVLHVGGITRPAVAERKCFDANARSN